MKNAKQMRAITLKNQKRNKRIKFNNVISYIKQKAVEGSFQYSTSFNEKEFTEEELQNFSDFLTSKGYDVYFKYTGNIKYIMHIKW